MRRDATIDFLKVMALFFVVAVHFLLHSGFYDLPINTNIRMAWMFSRQFTITAVPLFLIISGYLMGNRKIKPNYIFKITGVIGVYVIVSLVDWLLTTKCLGRQLSFSDALWGILDYSTDDYSWYVNMYLGLYLMTPVLSRIWQSVKDKHYHQYIILVTTLLIFAPSLMNSFGQVIPNFWTPIYPIGYFFLGAYLNSYRDDLKKLKWSMLFAISISITAVIFAINVHLNAGRIFEWKDYNDYMGYQPYLMSIVVTVWVLKITKLPNWLGRFLMYPAGASLWIYLFSDVSDRASYKFLSSVYTTKEMRVNEGGWIIFISFATAIIAGSLMRQIILTVKKFGGNHRE